MTNPRDDPVANPVIDQADAGLVAAARRGDVSAFNLLVDRYQHATFNVCLRMLGNRMAAEDATQEAFFSAYRHLDSFKGNIFRAWLLRIAANACTDELRRRQRRPAVSLDTPPPGAESPIDVEDKDAGPETVALAREQREAVQAALLRLPADQRLAVILCDMQGFSYEEIAESMRTSIGTVKSRIARGREKLRHELRASGEQYDKLERR